MPNMCSKLIENIYRRLRCSRCGLEADRDTVAILNIERKAIKKMRGTSGRPDCPAHDRCKPE
jgi:transposase